MANKKTNNVIIDLKTVKFTLKGYDAEIKAQQRSLDSEYKALRKKEDALWELMDQAQNLKQIVKLGDSLKAVAA